MNIIIVGCGKIGQALVEELSLEQEHSLTVIDLNYAKVQELTGTYDVMGVVGNGANLDTLLEAEVENSDLLIAVSPSDELNLLTCYIAKKVGNCDTIARVRNHEYRKSLNLFKEDMGLTMIINPEFTAASEMARVIRFPSAIQIDTFAKGRVEILKFKVPRNSILDNFRLSDMPNKLISDALVCGVERGDSVYVPGGDFVLKEGDLVSIVIPIESCTEFFKKIGVKTNRPKNCIIVGGGSTAFYLANRLIKSGMHIKIIEKNPQRCEVLCSLLPKATIICADGTDNNVLLEEGIENCEAFVSLTNIDEENVLLSLFARTMSDGKIVTKINRIAYDNVIKNLDLDSTIYPKYITAEHIIRYVRAKNNSMGCNIETMHNILDGKAEALEFRVTENTPVAGVLISKLNIKPNTLIACINRSGKIIYPRGYDSILPGDTVVVVTTNSGFNDITDILI